MAVAQAQGLEGRGMSASPTQRWKPSLDQRAQELHAAIALQEQGRKFFVQLCEEKLSQKREVLPKLREAVREDVRTLDSIEKGNKLSTSTACEEQKPLGVALARETVEVAQERLRSEIYDQVNTSNLLLYQLSQRSRAQGELQRRLQQLLDAEMDDKQHQAQAQMICQLENKIGKTLPKIRAAQTDSTLYLMARDVLKKELVSLLQHLDIMSRMSEMYHWDLEDMEHMPLEARKSAYIVKKDMADMETVFLMEREVRSQTLAAIQAEDDMLWFMEASQKHRRLLARFKFTIDSSSLQESLTDTESEDTKSQMDYRSGMIEKMEDAKALMKCSCIWDMHKRIQAKQNYSVDLKHHFNDLKEKKQALKKTLEELELKQAELKFRQTPKTTRCRMLEESLRMNLQKEEARLKQMPDQMLRNQRLLYELENAINKLFFCLYGITAPNQDDSPKATGMKEKFHHCRQKLQYLKQRVADLPPTSHSPDEDDEIFVKVRHILENTTASDTKNLKISLDDADNSVQDPLYFIRKGHSLALSREEIKQQGMQLIESNKSKKKK
ncbi:PREDICTED: coiled-coil domain-containing protein 183 [Apaloderma vittatum]|uniref:coiled-coil domain-containing protein 183 n=1 Tax=Apaloderma vittatum TaxID=57397 RepID=UPI00052142EB|nr:PREDICTED: coiled-coil domain-containing protein 183 [Apaloderma vittatum]